MSRLPLLRQEWKRSSKQRLLKKPRTSSKHTFCLVRNVLTRWSASLTSTDMTRGVRAAAEVQLAEDVVAASAPDGLSLINWPKKKPRSSRRLLRRNRPKLKQKKKSTFPIRT